MLESKVSPTAADQRSAALSRWDDDGGAEPFGGQHNLDSQVEQWDKSSLSNSDLVQLRIRVIALENVIIALLSQASDSQTQIIHEMATAIMPRSGYTPHPLTIHASTQMRHLVARAETVLSNYISQ